MPTLASDWRKRLIAQAARHP